MTQENGLVDVGELRRDRKTTFGSRRFVAGCCLREEGDASAGGCILFPMEPGEELGYERCDQCGFDAGDWPRARALAELGSHCAAWRAAFAGSGTLGHLQRRPAPTVWSAVEYAVHTARIAAWWREEIATCIAGGKVSFASGVYPDADVFPYNDIAPEDALAELERELLALRSLAAGFAREWDAPLPFEDAGIEAEYHSYGLRDITGAVLHVIHDAQHHLDDIQRGLSAVSSTP